MFGSYLQALAAIVRKGWVGGYLSMFYVFFCCRGWLWSVSWRWSKFSAGSRGVELWHALAVDRHTGSASVWGD